MRCFIDTEFTSLLNPKLLSVADSLALRAAWRTWHLVHERAAVFLRLLTAATVGRECWLYEWLVAPAAELDGSTPLDILNQANGPSRVEDALLHIRRSA